MKNQGLFVTLAFFVLYGTVVIYGSNHPETVAATVTGELTIALGIIVNNWFNNRGQTSQQ